MGNFKLQKYLPLLLIGFAFALTNSFNGCSNVSFFEKDEAAATKADSLGDGTTTVETIDTSGIDGTPIDEDTIDDLEDELDNRRRNRQTRRDQVSDDIPDIYQCGPKKVLICHIPPGNFAARHDICIGIPALRAHLGHRAANGFSDQIGRCIDLF